MLQCTEPAPHPAKNDPAPNVKSAKLEKPRMKAMSPKSVVTPRPLWLAGGGVGAGREESALNMCNLERPCR